MGLSGRTKYCMGKYGHKGEEIYSNKEAARVQQAVFRQLMVVRKEEQRKAVKEDENSK